MHGPVLVNWLLAALSAATGAYCLGRLRRRTPCHRTSPPPAAPESAAPESAGPPTAAHADEPDAAEALMALGMAAMAAAGPAVPPLVWAWLFGLPAAVFLVGALGALGAPARRAHRLHHAIGGLAMTYMALVMAAAPTGHALHAAGAGGGGGVPPVTGALLLYFGAYSLWTGSRLFSSPVGGPPGTRTAGALTSAGVATAGLPRACRLAMGIGMFAMLLTT
ncbi:DUF5134 domain-containing protein [Kitasatospora sp. NPDC054939]